MTRAARIRFAAGDFGFNLYWQSINLYLLFYYTDVRHVSIVAAATIFAIGSVADGAADFAVGFYLDRVRRGPRRFAPVVVGAALPLAFAFVLAYAPLPFGDRALIAVLGATHLALRLAYTLANVPYAALIVRIAASSADRQSIAGWRMLFGTLATAAVALVTRPLVHAPGRGIARGFTGLAVLLAVVATVAIVQSTTGLYEAIPPSVALPRRSLAVTWRGVVGNAAFGWLVAAMAGMIVAATVLTKAALFYFAYDLHDAAAGDAALAILGLAGGLAIPVWMRVNRAIGGRRVWLAAVGLGLVATAAMAAADPHSVVAAQAFLAAMQVALVGINLAFWSLLPDTVDFGERATGIRLEATLFGLAAMVQKLVLAGAVAAFGLAFAAIGYRATGAQSTATLAGIRALLLIVPAAALLVSGLCIAANPLRHKANDGQRGRRSKLPASPDAADGAIQ